MEGLRLEEVMDIVNESRLDVIRLYVFNKWFSPQVVEGRDDVPFEDLYLVF